MQRWSHPQAGICAAGPGLRHAGRRSDVKRGCRLASRRLHVSRLACSLHAQRDQPDNRVLQERFADIRCDDRTGRRNPIGCGHSLPRNRALHSRRRRAGRALRVRFDPRRRLPAFGLCQRSARADPPARTRRHGAFLSRERPRMGALGSARCALSAPLGAPRPLRSARPARVGRYATREHCRFVERIPDESIKAFGPCRRWGASGMIGSGAGTPLRPRD